MRPKVRKVLFWVHLWLGSVVGLYLVLLGLTGSLIVYGHEIDAKANPHLFKVSPGTDRAPFSSVIRAAKAEFPDEELYRVRFPRSPDGVYEVYGEHKPDRPSVFVDPYTGRVLGKRRMNEAPVGFASYLHINLMFDDPELGTLVSGYAALASVVLLVSGVWLWWPRTRAQLAIRLKVTRGQSLSRTVHDLHNVFGMYSLPLLLMLVITGAMFTNGFAWNAVEATVKGVTRSDTSPYPELAVDPAGGAAVDLDRALAEGLRRYPGLHVDRVWLPRKPDQPLHVALLPGAANESISVYVDPYTGRTLKVVDSRQGTAADVVMSWIEPLHFGTWAGNGSRVLAVLVGLVPAALFATGVIKLVRRKRAQATNRRKRLAKAAIEDNRRPRTPDPVPEAEDARPVTNAKR